MGGTQKIGVCLRRDCHAGDRAGRTGNYVVVGDKYKDYIYDKWMNTQINIDNYGKWSAMTRNGNLQIQIMYIELAWSGLFWFLVKRTSTIDIGIWNKVIYYLLAQIWDVANFLLRKTLKTPKKRSNFKLQNPKTKREQRQHPGSQNQPMNRSIMCFVY